MELPNDLLTDWFLKYDYNTLFVLARVNKKLRGVLNNKFWQRKYFIDYNESTINAKKEYLILSKFFKLVILGTRYIDIYHLPINIHIKRNKEGFSFIINDNLAWKEGDKPYSIRNKYVFGCFLKSTHDILSKHKLIKIS